ncbi:hypothetical protein niasHT_025063 [Heterodera trifolii]|uniref:Uncharacterized protein n=1 Tax=Heterodera trifolii TaxID=157864 RepID=A0ABD2KKS7_9BILA
MASSPSSPSPLFSVLSVLANSNLFPFFFALSIGIPSALLYCLELVVIVANFADFNSAFFVLFAFRAVSDTYIHIQPDNATFTLDNYKTDNKFSSTYKLRKVGHQNATTIEHKLTIFTVVTFFGHFIDTISWVLVSLTSLNEVDEQNKAFSYVQMWFGFTFEENETLFQANFNQFPWVNDLCLLAIPAWLLLWASSKMREIIAKKFNWLRRNQQQKNIAIVTVKRNVVPMSAKVQPQKHLLTNH